MDLHGLCQIKNLIDKKDDYNPTFLAYKVPISHVGQMFISNVVYVFSCVCFVSGGSYDFKCYSKVGSNVLSPGSPWLF